MAGTPTYTLTAGGTAGPGAGGHGGTSDCPDNAVAGAAYGGGGGGGPNAIGAPGGAGGAGCIIIIYTPVTPAPAREWGLFNQVDQPSWLGAPIAAAPIRLLTAQHFFGIGGQVPAKFWRYDYLIEFPQWQGAPGAAAPLQLPPAQNFFDASGQVPAKFWRYDYLIEFPQWQGAPGSAAPLQLPPAQNFFDASGQVQAKFWRYDYLIELPQWQRAPGAAASVLLPPPAQNFFGASGQVPAKFWRYDYLIELPQWQGAPGAAASVLLPPPQFGASGHASTPQSQSTGDSIAPAGNVVAPPPDKWVQRGAAEYAQALAALLPTGPAWPRELASVLQTVIAGLAKIWGDQVEALAALLLTIESDPRATVMLLPDWERAWGLPDPCLAEPLTIADRQSTLVNKMTMLGAQSRAYMIEQAAREGYTITIKEFAPFMCGVSRCGDTYNLNPDQDGSPRWQIGPPEMRFYWTTGVGTARLSWFRCASGQCGVDPMLRIGIATDLDCLLTRIKPAQTEIVFDYSGLVSGGPFAGTP